MSFFILGFIWMKFQSTDEKDTVEVKLPNEFKLDERSKELVGSWLIEGGDWGFVLHSDGTATSINSATLVYQRWRIHNGKLCLRAKSMGNHTQSVSEDCSVYKIEKRRGRLVLGADETKTAYKKIEK